MTKATTVSQADLARCLRALRDAGHPDGCVVIDRPDGTRVTVMPGKTLDPAVETAKIDSHDRQVAVRRKNPFPGVTAITDRHGKRRFRLRRTVNGRKVNCYIPGPYGSAEFREAYEEALDGARVESRRAQAGTVAYLIEGYLASAAFRGLSDTTRASKIKRLDWIRWAIGDADYVSIEPRHVETLMEKKGGPVAANRLKKDLAQLFRFGAKRYRFRGQNPASLADAHKVRAGGYHTWTEDEIDTYRSAHPSGTKARLALEILLCTGASRQDAVALSRDNLRGDRIFYSRGKTAQEVDVPILYKLADELALIPPGQLMLLAWGSGRRAYTVGGFGNWFKEQCVEAGLPHCTAHGLRKAGARRLAEAGGTEWEVMAFLGHRSAREGSRYVSAANRRKLTTSGLAKLGLDGNENVSNPPLRLDKR